MNKIIYPSLHANTEYSFLESTIRIKDLIKEAVSKGLQELVITDRNSMFGVSEFIHLCKENNIKPIIGVDFDVEDFRIIVLAQNYNGYLKLCDLVTKKNINGNLEISDLNLDDLIFIDHPNFGYYRVHNMELKIPKYYIGCQEEEKQNGVYVLNTNTLNKNESIALKILSSISGKNNSINNHYQWITDSDFNLKIFSNLKKIIDDCCVKFPEYTHENILPKFTQEDSQTSIELLKETINKEFKVMSLKIMDEKKDEYISRIKTEMEAIGKLGFSDYFLIIWDLVKWSKSKGILVGPGRGSAAGSLISFILNITEIDPIKYGLLFERFLNVDRVSMPDIDIDFQDDRRQEAIEYLFSKYGKEKTSLISTFQRIGSKMALRDVGRYLKIPNYEIDGISKLIKSGVTLEDSYNNNSSFKAMIEKTERNIDLFNKSKLIEGLPRQVGTHPAGIIISKTPINKKFPLFTSPEGFTQVQAPLNYLEENGLLKIDILGLRTLSIIKDIQEQIKDHYDKKINLLQINLSDEKTYNLLSLGDTVGIFQLESYGMMKTIAQIGVNNIDEISDIISLYRPGPMENIGQYQKGKSNKTLIKIDPEIDPILKKTYGIIIYQEQIMEIVQKFSNMTFSEADIFRRAISKKDDTLLNSLKMKFIEKAKQKNKDIKTIEKVYEYILKFANYGFNKSHAISYSILTYRIAFLKARFPIEFYTCLIQSSIGSIKNIEQYIKGAKKTGLNISGPSIKNSQEKTYSNESTIFLPFNIIKGLGQKANEKLIEALKIKKDFNDFIDCIIHLHKNGITTSIFEALIEANVFREFGNMKTITNYFVDANRYIKTISYVKDGETIIDESISPKPKIYQMDKDIGFEILNEVSRMGMNINIHYTTPYEGKYLMCNMPENKKIEIPVYFEKAWPKKAKNGDMAILSISDSSGKYNASAFNDVWKNIKRDNNNKVYMAKIEKRKYNGLEQYIMYEPWKDLKDE